VVLIYIPDRPWELALVLCLFDAYGVPHFVHNSYLGGLFPACPQIEISTTCAGFIFPPEMLPTRQLLEDFFPGLGATPYEMSDRDKLRVVLECFLGGWFIPGSKWPHREAA
jgi:hypothetical protein